MKSADMAHIATLVFIIELALTIYGTENVRNVEKHYAMFTESYSFAQWYSVGQVTMHSKFIKNIITQPSVRMHQCS